MSCLKYFIRKYDKFPSIYTYIYHIMSHMTLKCLISCVTIIITIAVWQSVVYTRDPCFNQISILKNLSRKALS